VAREFAARAGATFGAHIERIVLFGSVARGTDGPESDVDILVLLRGAKPDVREGLDAIAFDLTLSTGRSPSLVLYPVARWEAARAGRSDLVAAVEREGQTLWTRNDARSSLRA